MGDLYSKNRDLFVRRYEHAKLVAQANIQAREIRIIELEEEIERCKVDIEAQNKVIEEQEKNILLQKQALEAEQINKPKDG